MAKRYFPTRGDVVWIDFEPGAGREQAGRRPALVLSPKSYNRKVRLAILCPVTTKAKGYPFEVPLPDGLPVTGVVLSDQAKSLDWRIRNAEFLCAVPGETLDLVLAKLATLLKPGDPTR